MYLNIVCSVKVIFLCFVMRKKVMFEVISIFAAAQEDNEKCTYSFSKPSALQEYLKCTG